MFDGGLKDDEDRFIGRECYEFNTALESSLDDERCIHCRFFLTVNCKYIQEFVDEEGDV